MRLCKRTNSAKLQKIVDGAKTAQSVTATKSSLGDFRLYRRWRREGTLRMTLEGDVVVAYDRSGSFLQNIEQGVESYILDNQ